MIWTGGGRLTVVFTHTRVNYQTAGRARRRGDSDRNTRNSGFRRVLLSDSPLHPVFSPAQETTPIMSDTSQIPFEMCEGVEGTWHYHIRRPCSFDSLCGARVMFTESRFGNWGMTGHLNERYCVDCWDLMADELTPEDRETVWNCCYCCRDVEVDANNDCLICGNLAYDRTKIHRPQWSRKTASIVECLTCGREGPYSIQGENEFCVPRFEVNKVEKNGLKRILRKVFHGRQRSRGPG